MAQNNSYKYYLFDWICLRFSLKIDPVEVGLVEWGSVLVSPFFIQITVKLKSIALLTISDRQNVLNARMTYRSRGQQKQSEAVQFDSVDDAADSIDAFRCLPSSIFVVLIWCEEILVEIECVKLIASLPYLIENFISQFWQANSFSEK